LENRFSNVIRWQDYPISVGAGPRSGHANGQAGADGSRKEMSPVSAILLTAWVNDGTENSSLLMI
jgi:hypothetical protein